jgi:hypothetical protein
MGKEANEILEEVAIRAGAEAMSAGHYVGDFQAGQAINSRGAFVQCRWAICLNCKDSVIAFADGEVKYPPACIQLPRPPSESGWF